VAGPNDARRTFAVTVRAIDDGTFAGRLEIRAPTEAATDREVTGPSCAAVTTALALVAALAIDPESMRSETLPAAASEPPPPATPLELPPPPRPAASAPSPVWRWRVGADAEVAAAITPTPALGGGAFAEIASSAAEDGIAETPLGLSSFRLAVHYAQTATVHRDGAAASFDWASLGLEGCALRVRLGRRADARACAAFDAGALWGQGGDVARPESPIRPWWSVAPLLRFQWFASSSWFLDAEAALIVPLRRDTFVFEDPTVVFHTVPPVGARAGLGLGYELGDRNRGERP
jgi:hypothetical protein